jgi:hypothetical protein
MLDLHLLLGKIKLLLKELLLSLELTLSLNLPLLLQVAWRETFDVLPHIVRFVEDFYLLRLEGWRRQL